MGKRRGVAALAAMLAMSSMSAWAQDGAGPALPAIPDKDADAGFEGVPAPWRDYLLQAREAERLDGWLERCLAYPDLPDTAWPAGHAAAHCHVHAARPLGLDEVEARLERGDAAGLEAQLDQLLARHFTDAVDNEDIHVVVAGFRDAGPEADRVSARWLSLAPRSAWAHLARGNHFRAAAWKARGSRWARETPDASMRRMRVFAGQAVPMFREALRIDPALMPAYEGLLNMGMLDSDDAGIREAMAGAERHDPACLDIATLRMQSLEPRWGGSYEEMLSYGYALSRHLARRPALAIHIAAPYTDLANLLRNEPARAEERGEVLRIAVRTGSSEDALRGAAQRELDRAASGVVAWKAIALLLQEHRFNTLSGGAYQTIARALLPYEPEWSLRYARAALAAAPDDATVHLLLGSGYRAVGLAGDAERHLQVAARDPAHRRYALGELALLFLYGPGLVPTAERAREAAPHIDRLLEAYPQDGLGWLLRLDQQLVSGQFDPEVVRTFLRHADRQHPWQAQRAVLVERMIEEPGLPRP